VCRRCRLKLFIVGGRGDAAPAGDAAVHVVRCYAAATTPLTWLYYFDRHERFWAAEFPPVVEVSCQSVAHLSKRTMFLAGLKRACWMETGSTCCKTLV
jgi:hypothetical protein